METIRKIRCAYQRDGKSIRQIARDQHLSPKHRQESTCEAPGHPVHLYPPRPTPGPSSVSTKPGCWTKATTPGASLPRRQQRTAVLLFEELQREGFDGG